MRGFKRYKGEKEVVIVSVFVESGCSFDKGEYFLHLEGCVQDSLNLDDDIFQIKDCIENYEGVIRPGVTYTFFLHRANIATAFPGYDPAFDIQQVLEDIKDVNINL